MRPTFAGFETATRGLMSSQKALDIVGNNVANVGVTGYTRQRIDLVSVTVNTAYSRYYSKSGAISLAGQGSMAVGVDQIRDSFLDKKFRDQYSTVGYYDTLSAVLTDIETSLSEIEPTTLTSAFTKFENAISEMQANGVSNIYASSIMSAARSLTQCFNQISTKLTNQWHEEYYTFETNITQVNTLLSEIAQLNKAINNEVTITYDGNIDPYGPNEMMDQRNVLIDELARFADISVTEHSDGTVTITMGDDNHVAVEGDFADSIWLNRGMGELTANMGWSTTGDPTRFQTGALQASFEMLNGRGAGATPSIGETLDNGILYYMDKVNILAETVATAFNHVVPVYNEDGTPTNTFKQLFSFNNDAMPTAANITVNSDWQNDASYLITNIFAPGDGENNTAFATNMLSIFADSFDFVEFNGTFNEYISFYTNSQLATNIEFCNNSLEISEEVSNSTLNQISSISGVMLDEEGIDMSQWTKAYNAMSRIMTAMDDMLDKLINGTGRVGL